MSNKEVWVTAKLANKIVNELEVSFSWHTPIVDAWVACWHVDEEIMEFHKNLIVSTQDELAKELMLLPSTEARIEYLANHKNQIRN